MTLPGIKTFLNSDYQPLKDDFTPLYKEITEERAYEFLDEVTKLQFEADQFDLSKMHYDKSTIRFFGSPYIGTVWDGILGAVKGLYLAQISDSNGKSLIFKLIYSYDHFGDTLKELLDRLEKITVSIDGVIYIDREASNSKFLDSFENYRVVCPIKRTDKAVKFMNAIPDKDFKKIRIPKTAPEKMIKKYKNTFFAEVKAFPLDSMCFRAGIFWDKDTNIRYGFFVIDKNSDALSLCLGYPSRQSIENIFKEGKNGVKIDRVYNCEVIKIENIIFDNKLKKVQKSQESIQKRLRNKELKKESYETKLSVWHEKKKEALAKLENELYMLKEELAIYNYKYGQRTTESEHKSTQNKMNSLEKRIEKKETKISEFKLKFAEILQKKQMIFGKLIEDCKDLKEKSKKVEQELKKYSDKISSGEKPLLYGFTKLGSTVFDVGLKELILNMNKEIVSMITNGDENWDILTVRDVLADHKGNVYSTNTTRIIELTDFRLKKIHMGVEKFIEKLNNLKVQDIDGKVIQFSIMNRTPKRRIPKAC